MAWRDSAPPASQSQRVAGQAEGRGERGDGGREGRGREERGEGGREDHNLQEAEQ